MLKPRMVIITVESLVEIMKDYLGPDNLPEDAKVVSLKVNLNEKGRFAIEVTSPNIKYTDVAMDVNYRLRRVFGVGNA